MLFFAVVFECGDHSKPDAVVAKAAVVAWRVTMAPHDVIDDGPGFSRVELLIALGAEKERIRDFNLFNDRCPTLICNTLFL